jgi:hypothetical protein
MVFDSMILPKQGWICGSNCIFFKPCKLWYMCGSVETIADDNVDNDDDDSTSDCSHIIWYNIPKI